MKTNGEELGKSQIGRHIKLGLERKCFCGTQDRVHQVMKNKTFNVSYLSRKNNENKNRIKYDENIWVQTAACDGIL